MEVSYERLRMHDIQNASGPCQQRLRRMGVHEARQSLQVRGAPGLRLSIHVLLGGNRCSRLFCLWRGSVDSRDALYTTLLCGFATLREPSVHPTVDRERGGVSRKVAKPQRKTKIARNEPGRDRENSSCSSGGRDR